MNDKSPHPPRQASAQALIVGVFLLIAILLAISWSIALNRLSAEQALVLANAKRQQENIATIVAENLTQILDRGRLLAITAGQYHGGTQEKLLQMLTSMRSLDAAILRIALYDLSGERILASSSANDSEALRTALNRMLASGDQSNQAAIRVVLPEDAYYQAWEIPLLYSVVDREGKYGGTLLAVVDVGYFLQLYRGIEIGKSGTIRILSEEGRPLAEADRTGMALITEHTPLSKPPIRSEHPESQLESSAQGQGSRLSSYRHLANFPMIVAVSGDLDEMEMEQRQGRSRMLALLGLTSVLMTIAAIWITLNVQRNGQLLRSLEHMNTDNLRLIDQLEHEKNRAFNLAAHDHLTGLHNRRMFHELVTSHLHRAKRSHHHYALMYLDLDRFKSINDTLGHHVGDLLLQTIASRLKVTLRESDVIARLGGDEFAVLITGLETIQGVQQIADKLIEQLGKICNNLDGNDIHVTPSIGIALFPRDGVDFDSLCRSADAAMYQSKRNGRGRYTFYDPTLNTHDGHSFNLEQRLPSAIQNGEFVLHYQPKIRLSDCCITGFEALVRWNHPEYGLIYPGEFIPLAENSGAFIALGEWVIASCCKQLVEWREAGLDNVPIAFNVSAKHLLDENLPQFIARNIAIHQIDGALLEAEITEKSLLDSFDMAASTLHALDRLGLTIALDDCGNGLSNLGYLRSLPIHCIKIDRSFIDDIHKSHDKSAIVDSIISLAHKLHKKVVAEGIETADQLIHLKTVNCDELQGFYFSRPVSAELARDLLAASILSPAS